MRPRPYRLGMLGPSSNTVIEPETWRLLPPDGTVTAHVSRLRVVQISADAQSLSQFEMAPVIAAAQLLADAEVDLILWNGTSASWLGPEWDRSLIEAVERHTGIPATTAVRAIDAELERLSVRRIGLVTPYIEELERRIIANYRSRRIDVCAAERLDLTKNTAYADIAPAEIADMVRRVAASPVRPDAIVIMCTNLAGSSIAEAVSAELGIPVLDSVRVAVRHCLALLPALRPGG
ncbi:maleate cis-trans isomerase family protein [Labrys monachus]|uniref:Maleate isomerase n=1 Tax=Labrys monachus TaxID=217067 RepID=A0ABU0FIB4_9HYPH|nr:aspartate/glutamate racemase family protein [Labrys monachus]MDQ0394354.1 maleate isomerase [Labrys monachus]